jgi:Sec-independent protein translocase protein TatA
VVLDALELGVIVLMGIGVLVWGPEKVPEIARQIGSARKQLDVYTKQLSGISSELQKSATTGNLDNLNNILTGFGTTPTPENSIANQAIGAAVPASALSAPAAVMRSADQLLLEMAKKLGIVTQGKTRDEIQNEILARASPPVEVQAPPAPASESAPAPAAEASSAPVFPSPLTDKV